jgi:hypothetical protein
MNTVEKTKWLGKEQYLKVEAMFDGPRAWGKMGFPEY